MKHCSRCDQTKPESEFGKRTAARDGLHPWCRECTREYARQKYADDPERVRAAVQAYRDNNREVIRQRDRERYKRERGKRAEWWQRYYRENREAILRRTIEWGKNNRDKCREAEARYREVNREKRRVAGRRLYREQSTDYLRAKAVRNTQRRRARKRQATVVAFTREQVEQKMAYWGDRCWMCGGPREAIDHVKPLSKGGPHALANLRPACHGCNGTKANKWPFEMATERLMPLSQGG